MLTRTTYLNALTAAQRLAGRNIALTARPSTPLGQLLAASCSVEAAPTTSVAAILSNPTTIARLQDAGLGKDEDFRANEVEYVTSDKEGEPSLHSRQQGALIDDLKPYVLSHISTARNTVLPLVADLAGKMEKFLQEANPTDPMSQFTIDQRLVPALLLDEVFLNDELNGYTGTQYAVPSMSIEFTIDVTPEYLMSLVNLSSDRLNGLVQDWLRTKPAKFLEYLWYANFDCRDSGHGEVVWDYALYNKRNGKTAGVFDALDTALGCYLIARRIMLEVPSMNLKGGLAEFKDMNRKMIDYAGAEVMRCLRVIGRQIEADTVVSEIDPIKKRVVVNRNLYKDWLERGGKVETILGMLISGRPIFSGSALLDSQDSLLNQWNAYVMLTDSERRDEMRKRFLSFVTNEAMFGLDNLTELEKDFVAQNPDFKQRAMKAIEEQLEHLHHRLMEDLWHTALHVIAKGRFYYTSAYDILREMAEVEKSNPNVDPRDAALLSAISYVLAWAADQTEIVK